MASLNLADPDPEPPVESGEHPKKEAARAKWQSQWQAHHCHTLPCIRDSLGIFQFGGMVGGGRGGTMPMKKGACPFVPSKSVSI